MYYILRYHSNKKTWQVCGVPSEQRMDYKSARMLLKTLRKLYPDEKYQLVFDSNWN